MQQIAVYSSQMLLLYMFRMTIPPIIRGTCAVYGHRYAGTLSKCGRSGRHDAEQQDSNYLQLHTTHTDRTTLLRTYLLTNCACIPVAIYSTCTPDDGWDCHPKHVKHLRRINRNLLHLVGIISLQRHDARNHKY